MDFNTAMAKSVHMTASDAHFTNIARSVSWGVREIRVRRLENYKAMNKIRESVFTGSFFSAKFLKHVPQLFYLPVIEYTQK